ncbi:DJ-1/PfpI family protein [Leptospira sp. WS39.C2]
MPYIDQFPIKPKHKTPIITIIGDNQYTELTDFMVPYGILKKANISQLFALAPERGVLEMFPALKIEITTSFDDFDRLHPEGSDIIIVPAIHNAKNPIILKWLLKQKELGASFIGICDGVWTLGHAGLLEWHSATGHWYSKDNLIKTFPKTKWIQNQRYVQDKNIITTSGVTASIPITIALIESLVGTKKAKQIALEYGIDTWDPNHNSEIFTFHWKHYTNAAKNLIFFWEHETIGIPILDGIDEVSLALVADALARTYKTNVKTISLDQDSIQTISGLKIITDMKGKENKGIDFIMEIPKEQKSFTLLKETLRFIETKHGKRTMEFVNLQLEFPYESIH